MSDASRFDAFYVEARDRLLVQAFALTGDLPASRGAVRDAFVAAWHHWSKVRRLEDPEAWVRPHAWAHAQRRHTARIWHRDRRLDPDVRATLDALAKLSVVPRKTLLLNQLSKTSREEMAREVGLPLEAAERRLQAAATQFSLNREVSTTAFRPLFEQLSDSCGDPRWPRATIVRRAGSARRRAHTTAGVVAVVVALLGSGYLVADQRGVHPTLAAAGDRVVRVSPSRSTRPSAQPTPEPNTNTPGTVTAADLLTREQVGRAVPGRSWRSTGTDLGPRRALPCQRGRYAGPRPVSALVRGFSTRSTKHKPALAATQTMELSAGRAAAGRAFANAAGWFGGCLAVRTQLVSVRRVAGLGDEAEQYTLRSWRRPAATLVLGVARTGRMTTVTFTRTGGTARPDLGANLRLLVSAVDDLCPLDGGGHCSSLPKARVVSAPRAGRTPMMLSEFDLPPVAGVRQPWVGTNPRQALQNVAATGCDRSSLHGHGWRRDATRSFVVPAARLAPAFGLTETVGRLAPTRARTFLAGVRSRLASCSDRELGTKVQRLARSGGLSAWRVRTEVTDKQTVTFFMGIARRGGAVAQVGFVPDGSHTIRTGDFVALVGRARARLAEMPE